MEDTGGNTNYWKNWDFTNPIRQTVSRRIEVVVPDTYSLNVMKEIGVGEDITIDCIKITRNRKPEVFNEKYDVLKIIGRGSFGIIHLVRDKEDGRLYSVRYLKKEYFRNDYGAGDVCARRQLTTTTRKIAELDSPFIVKVRKLSQTESKLSVFADYIPGGELFYQLKKLAVFPVEMVRKFGAQIACAFGCFHRNDMTVHEVKPENFVLDENGDVVFVSVPLSIPGVRVQYNSSPDYMAPELLIGKEIGKGVNWWSLGILMYEMWTGLPPFYSENINEMYQLILTKPVTFPSGHGAERYKGHDDLKDLLKGLIEKDPKKRLDFEEIKNHPFFKDIDWDRMESVKKHKQLDPDVNERLEYVIQKFFCFEEDKNLDVVFSSINLDGKKFMSISKCFF